MANNFLSDYLEYSSGNEASPNFHLWSCLSALSAIMSRRVWLDFKHFVLTPNLYVVLLGPPGSKKNTAIDLCTGLLHVLNGKDANRIPFAADSGSKEKLVKELAASTRKFKLPNGEERVHSPLNIFVTELSQFLGTKTAAHMLDFLTTVYSQSRYVSATVLHGREIIEGPCVTLLGATVPDWITAYLKTDVITGGFSRRVNFVYEVVDGEPIPFPTITDEQRLAYTRLVERGHRLLEISGEMQWSDPARAFYDKWYRTHQKNLPQDPNLQFYYKTKFVQMLKVAMLLNLAKHDELVLQEESIHTSLAILSKAEANLPKVFQGMGRNELSSVSNKVIELLHAHQGPLPEKRVRSLLWKDANGQEMFNILQHLVQSEKLYLFEAEENGVKRTWLALPEHVEELKKKGRMK